MPVTASVFPEGMKREAYEYYWESYDKTPRQYEKVYTVKTTDALYEKSTSAVGTGLLEEKAETATIAEKSPIEGFVVYAKIRDWGKKEKVSRAVATDHQKFRNFLKSQMPQWTEDAKDTIDQHCADIFNYGGYTAGHDIFNATIPGVLTDSSGDKIYDSIQFFAPTGTNHTSKGGTTYYNGLGALNFTHTNLQTAYTMMTVTNAYKEDDTPMENVPDIVLANPSLRFDINKVLKSTEDPGTANRATNVLYDIVKPLYWRRLTDTNQWQLVNTKMGSLVLYMRENPELDMWEDKDRKCYYMSIFMRFGVMVKNFRGVVSANYSTS